MSISGGPRVDQSSCQHLASILQGSVGHHCDDEHVFYNEELGSSHQILPQHACLQGPITVKCFDKTAALPFS